MSSFSSSSKACASKPQAKRNAKHPNMQPFCKQFQHCFTTCHSMPSAPRGKEPINVELQLVFRGLRKQAPSEARRKRPRYATFLQLVSSLFHPKITLPFVPHKDKKYANTFNLVSFQQFCYARLAGKKPVELASASSPRRTNVRPQRSNPNRDFFATNFKLLSTGCPFGGRCAPRRTRSHEFDSFINAERALKGFCKQFQSCFISQFCYARLALNFSVELASASSPRLANASP